MRTEMTDWPQNKHRRASCIVQNCRENNTKRKYCLEHSYEQNTFLWDVNSGIYALVTKKNVV